MEDLTSQGTASVSISVVIPAYNAASLLPRAVESVLAQTLQPCDIVVVDDGSNDKTLEVASRYGNAVRVLKKQNGGPASARNLGVQNTAGKWIAFLDADDSWLPGKLERQVKLIRDGVAVVCSRAQGTPLRLPAATTFAELWRRNFIINSSALVRRRAFSEVGGLDEDPLLVGVEDYNLWLRISAAGWQIVAVDEELCIRHRTPTSLSHHTLRRAEATLTNIRKVASQLKLRSETVREREVVLCDEIGLELVGARDTQNARHFFKRALVAKPTLRRLASFGATYAPKFILDWHRSRRRDQQQSSI
jgi:glycosyltransferase involved in cell wall biosynthesis